MPPILSIVGHKNSGKTTLAERVVRFLSDAGVRVATIKHDAHRFEVDHEGKDSWRLKHAGSVATVLASSERIFCVQDVAEAPTLEELCARYVRDVDLVLAEGFKLGPQPKIEVSRRATGKPLLDLGGTRVAVATDHPVDVDVPVFDLDDAEGVARFVRERFVGAADRTEPRVELRVGGRPVPLNPFVQRIVRSTIRGMIGALDKDDASPPGEDAAVELVLR